MQADLEWDWEEPYDSTEEVDLTPEPVPQMFVVVVKSLDADGKMANAIVQTFAPGETKLLNVHSMQVINGLPAIVETPLEIHVELL